MIIRSSIIPWKISVGNPSTRLWEALLGLAAGTSQRGVVSISKGAQSPWRMRGSACPPCPLLCPQWKTPALHLEAAHGQNRGFICILGRPSSPSCPSTSHCHPVLPAGQGRRLAGDLGVGDAGVRPVLGLSADTAMENSPELSTQVSLAGARGLSCLSQQPSQPCQ